MADFNTPFGRVPKPAVYLALIAGGGAAIYVYVKKKNAKKAEQAAAPAASTSQDGTGAYGYGAYGYGAFTYEPYGYGYGPFGLGSYGGSGQYGYGFYGAGVPVQVPTQATTNAQWAQAAVSVLTQGGNYTATTVLAALGLYLTGGQLDANQVTIVQSAIAAEGEPPVSGPNGFPPAINSSPPSGQGGGGGGGSGGGGTTTKPGSVSGFSVTGHTGFADFGWGAVAGASHYNLVITGPQSSTLNPTGNHAENVRLKAGRYSAKVQAVNSAGTGPFTSGKSFRVS